MKKAVLISILSMLLLVNFVSANLIEERISGDGEVVDGLISNTYEVDGYLVQLTGNEHILRSQPMDISKIMYLGIWFDDIKKDQTIEIYNYNTESWDYLGTGVAGLKVGLYYEINMTNHYNTTSNTADIRISSSNGDAFIDKIIFTKSSVSETIKRVEQVDWVSTVDVVNKLNTPEVKVHGTEYLPGEDGKVFLQLIEGGDTPINTASCFVTIYNPAGTPWVSDTLMTYLTGSNGLYYYDFTVPQTSGVYMTDAYCEYDTYSVFDYPDSYPYITGWYVSGNITSIINDDDNYLWGKEKNYGNGSFAGLTTVLMAHLDGPTNTNAEDLSPVGNDGTHYNSPTLNVVANLDTGVNYNKATDYTRFPNNAAYSLSTTDDVMICFGFNHPASEGNGLFILDSSYENSGTGWAFTWDGGDKIRFRSDYAGSGGKDIDSTGVYNTPGWHTACGFIDQVANVMSLYIDGVLQTTESQDNSGGFTSVDGITLAASGKTDRYTNTMLDEVCVIKGEINPSTINTYYSTYKTCGPISFDFDVTFEFDNVSILERQIYYNIETKYQWDDLHEDVLVYLYNFTGDEWYELENSLSYAVDDSFVSTQFLSSVNITQFLNNSQMLLRYSPADPEDDDSGNFKINQILLEQTNYVQSPATAIRGAGEVHVQNLWAFNNRSLTDNGNLLVAERVWTYTTRQLTEAQDTFVGGTEYDIEEGVGKIIVRMTDVSGDPVSGATCDVTIFYPDNTVYIENASMTEQTLSTHDGIYYYDFSLTTPLGLYAYSIDCTQGGKDYYLANTFHILNESNERLNYYSELSTQLSNTNESLSTDMNNYYSALSTQLTNTNTSLSNELNYYYVELSGQLNNSNNNISTDMFNYYSLLSTQLSNTNTSLSNELNYYYVTLNNDLDNVNDSIQYNMANYYLGMISNLNDVNESLSIDMFDYYSTLSTQLTNTNTSLSTSMLNYYSALPYDIWNYVGRYIHGEIQ